MTILLFVKSNRSDEDSVDINWDDLGFGLVPADYMYVMKCSQDSTFSYGELNRYGNIELSPSSGVLNYGQVSMIPNIPCKHIAKAYLHI